MNARHRREPYFWSWPMIISVLLFFVGIGLYANSVVSELTQSTAQPGPIATAPYHPIAPPVPQRPAQSRPAPTPTYTVKAGDSLWTIASRYRLTTGKASSSTASTGSAPSPPWEQLWHLNPQIKNPNLIHPGQILKL